MKTLLLLLVGTFGCSGCLPKKTPVPEVGFTTAHLTLHVQSALHTLHAATTGTTFGNEVGLCLTGYREGNVYHVTSVVVPPVQLGNTRTSVFILSCEGVPQHIGRAHFHPWSGVRGCHRSAIDASTHETIDFPVDVVVCPRGELRWYTATASGTGA